MFLDTCTAVKAAVLGTTASVPTGGGHAVVDESGITTLRDAGNTPCDVKWMQADPRSATPDSITLTTTQISVGLMAELPNPQLVRFPEKIYSPMLSNLTRIHRTVDHPEARLLQFTVTVRGEGTLAEPNVIVAATEVRRRFRHRSHLKVPTDLYRDGRQFTIPSLVTLTNVTMNRPDGVQRRQFSYDMVYTVDSWILFPDTRQNIRSVEEINLCLVDDTSGDTLHEIQTTVT